MIPQHLYTFLAASNGMSTRMFLRLQKLADFRGVHILPPNPSYIGNIENCMIVLLQNIV